MSALRTRDLPAHRAPWRSDPGGGGPYPATAEAFGDYTLYRPSTPPEVATPVLVWGNGWCIDDGLRYAVFLREVASHGFVVLALGPPRLEWPVGVSAEQMRGPVRTAEDEADETSVAQMIAAIDLADDGGAALGVPHLGPIGLMGHSCGGLQALAASADARVAATLVLASGVLPAPMPFGPQVPITKADLARLHAPVAYITGGPEDIARPSALDDVARITRAPVLLAELPVGHFGTFWADERAGAWARVTVDWFSWRLRGDVQAARAIGDLDGRVDHGRRWSVRDGA